MARKPSPPPAAPVLTDDQRAAFISRLKDRIRDLDEYPVGSVTESYPADLEKLSAAIDRLIEQAFGRGTSDYYRFNEAASLGHFGSIYVGNFGGSREPTPAEIQATVRDKISRSKVMLQGAIEALEQDMTIPMGAPKATTKPQADSTSIFVVHGHDEATREKVARLLEKLGLNPIILHEQPNQGRTIIEKFEHNSAPAGFAVVLLTADDLGGVQQDKLQPRARQNVLLELGYFVGKLGRSQVCALREEGVEIPSDFAGVVYHPLDAAGAWKFQLAKELKAAGYAVDLNDAI